MIPLEEIPRSGQLIIAAHFKDYDEYYANETRKALLNLPERRDVRDIGIEFYPLDFWLKRTIVTEKADEEKKRGRDKRWSIKRATGGLYKVGFANMTPEKFKKLCEVLKKMKKTYWEEYEILIASQVEGV
ncbi:MAG: hypothetical protein H3Z53_11240 [archaeon]|nr:hypothetical protein [archaeon]MCP8314926.1 hypothetical protein [archaeon]